MIPKNIKDRYALDGFAAMPEFLHFSKDDINSVLAKMNSKIAEEHPSIVREEVSGSVRAVHGYEYDHLQDMMVKLRKAACEIIGCSDAYIHQYRINIKRAITGGNWKPHRDFDFWHMEDGMLVPEAVLFHVCITDHTCDNGPIMVVPGSHLVEETPNTIVSKNDSKDWKKCFAEKDLKYQINQDNVEKATRRPVPLVGEKGSVYAMHPLLWHFSEKNESNTDRILLSVIYNSIDNVPTKLNHRPYYIAQPPPDVR